MREIAKRAIKDTVAEPYVRWVIKRTRGLRMPFDLVKDEIFDRQAFEVMDRVLTPASTCVDVGCHRGQFLAKFLECSPGQSHLAFEPVPFLAEHLRSAFPSARVLELALSDEAGDAEFFVIPDAPARSGLRPRDHVKSDLVRQKVSIRTERLDAIIEPGCDIDLIKIDAEGAEGLVLKGAVETIRRCRPHIIFEHGDSSSRAFGIPSEDIFDLLVEDCGLSISVMVSWLRGGDPLTREGFSSQKSCWCFLAHPGPVPAGARSSGSDSGGSGREDPRR